MSTRIYLEGIKKAITVKEEYDNVRAILDAGATGEGEFFARLTAEWDAPISVNPLKVVDFVGKQVVLPVPDAEFAATGDVNDAINRLGIEPVRDMLAEAAGGPDVLVRLRDGERLSGGSLSEYPVIIDGYDGDFTGQFTGMPENPEGATEIAFGIMAIDYVITWSVEREGESRLTDRAKAEAEYQPGTSPEASDPAEVGGTYTPDFEHPSDTQA